MNYVKNNKSKLANLIKECNTTQVQLNQMKKSLTIYDQQINPFKKLILKKSNSQSLMKSSRIHMDQFQKRQTKLNSSHSQFLSLNSSLVLSTQKKQNSSQNISSKLQNNQNRRKISQKFHHVQTNKQKSQKIQKPQKTLKQMDQYSQSDQQSILKHRRQQSNHYLPRINSTYIQTFSPKNASLSQQTLVKRQLQKSVFKKSYDEKCKEYNKENLIKQYEEKKRKMEQKLESYRLSVLKKISFDNVKKYLYNQKKRKQAHTVALLKQTKLYKSFMQDN